MKCGNCPAYCEETYYTNGAPIGVTETYCCIDFEQCDPREGCKRTLNEVKTNIKLKELNNKSQGVVMTVAKFLENLYKGNMTLNNSFGEWLNEDGKSMGPIYSDTYSGNPDPNVKPTFVHWHYKK